MIIYTNSLINLLRIIIIIKIYIPDMFDDMFDTAEEILTGVKQGAVLSSWDRLPKNCAHLLNMPQKQRRVGYPIGLKNQGATCYLNGFLQILYHTPQLRKMILDLPLSKEENQDTQSQLFPEAQRKFLFGFQRLFSQMSLKDCYSVGTDYLNEAFGWQGKEHVQQQDMSEAMKIIFDTIQRALYKTPFEQQIKSLFKGVSARYKSCRNCSCTTQKQQDFFDFMVNVDGVNSLDEALIESLKCEQMSGENKIFCDTCQSNQDMWLGTKFKSLPQIIVFSLNRFTFDYNTFSRIKLNSYFQFNLEQNLNHLIEGGAEQEYQLYGVIIHRGSAQGGHYFCYIRDILKEGNWQNSISEKISEDKIKNKQTEENSNKKEQSNQSLTKQDVEHQLVLPSNISLTQNWFELNDSIVSAIDAKKITSQYEGSESAYVLFYRKRQIKFQKQGIKVPEYLKQSILQQNKLVQKQRIFYESQKQQIILKIQGNQNKISIKTTVKALLQKFCPENFSLVMEAQQNELPYYPIQFINSPQVEYSEEDTIQKLQVYHESQWKLFFTQDQQYLTHIRPNIGKDKVPFSVNMLKDGTTKSMTLYQNWTLQDFRSRIKDQPENSQFCIPYQNQMIQLITPYKQIFVTDDLNNDTVLLNKLGFLHQCQVVLKNIEPTKANSQNKCEDFAQNIDSTKQLDNDLLCFVFERDDQIGIKKIYFSKYQKLSQLLAFILKSQGLSYDRNKRLRNLNGNRLYYSDQYQKQLLSLNMSQQMIKMRLQRGQIPIKGDICIKVKLQSKFQQQPQDTQLEKVFDPNTTVLDMKIDICRTANIDPEKHVVYQTDWMYEPVRSITKQNQSLFQAHFARQETVCIRDNQSPIRSQLVHFQVFLTKTGSPQDISRQSFHSKIQMHKTVLNFKENLFTSKQSKDCMEKLIDGSLEQIKPKTIRIRQLKRDFMFGNIWRNHNKQMKDVQVNSSKIVIQLLSQEQQLKEDQIVLILKRRNIQKRLYQHQCQLIFNAGKQPKVQDLQKAIKEKILVKNQQIQFPILLIKYYNYNFQWIQISQKKLKQFGSSKQNSNKKNPKKENQQKQTSNEKSQVDKTKQANQDTKKSDQVSIDKGHSQHVKQTQNIQANKVEFKINNQQDLSQGIELNKQSKNQQAGNINQEKQQTTTTVNDSKKHQFKNDSKNKTSKKRKQQTQIKKDKKQDHLNLRKNPTLLKDGDFIGWANQSQVRRFKDDLQTDQDLSLKMLKKNNKDIPLYRRNENGGFKVNVGF